MQRGQKQFDAKKRTKLLGELSVIVPFLSFSLFIFVVSLQYKFGAKIVPLIISGAASILAGLRFIHILFPDSGLGRFEQQSLVSQFDGIQKSIEEDLQKSNSEEEHVKPINFRDEIKACVGLIGSFLAFLFFGYLVGTFIAIAGISTLYGYRKKLVILLILISVYFIVYVLLFRLLDGPMYSGLLLSRLLKALGR
ncbi:MAG: tripartite tricarboxylate transporter TctB family protein [Deltaproteobacteria bacterium]